MDIALHVHQAASAEVAAQSAGVRADVEVVAAEAKAKADEAADHLQRPVFSSATGSEGFAKLAAGSAEARADAEAVGAAPLGCARRRVQICRRGECRVRDEDRLGADWSGASADGGRFMPESPLRSAAFAVLPSCRAPVSHV